MAVVVAMPIAERLAPALTGTAIVRMALRISEAATVCAVVAYFLPGRPSYWLGPKRTIMEKGHDPDERNRGPP